MVQQRTHGSHGARQGTDSKLASLGKLRGFLSNSVIHRDPLELLRHHHFLLEVTVGTGESHAESSCQCCVHGPVDTGWVKDMSTPKINYDVKNIHVDSDSMYLCSYICTERIVRAC